MAKAKKLRTAEAEVKVSAPVAITKSQDIDEKALAKEGKRITNLTDVTVTKEALTKAVVKSGKIPGNEVPTFVEFLLKEIICAP